VKSEDLETRSIFVAFQNLSTRMLPVSARV